MVNPASTIVQLPRRTIKVKVKKGIAVRELHLAATGNNIPYGITQCYLPPGRGDFLAFTQPKLVLDLATPKGCKAELT